MMINKYIEKTPLSSLKSYGRNARTHSKKQIRQIAASIEEFGFTNPVLIDNDHTILAGHGRVDAVKLLGWHDVPCIRVESMTAHQKRAYVLADNKIGMNAQWDEDLLAEELQAIIDMDGVSFDVGITGFSIEEVDHLLEGVGMEEANNPADDYLPEFNNKQTRCCLGDIWKLGDHRLICGNGLIPETVARLMDGMCAQMIFTDPPYNVPVEGHVCGLGRIKHREFAMACGEMSSTQFTDFLRRAFENMVAHSLDGSIHFICMDWRHMGEMLYAGGAVYDELKNLIVWAKDNGGMGTFYRSRHELIFVFKHGKAPHVNTFELGQKGRYRTNVWEYKGVNSRGSHRKEALHMHPTVKPVQMIADAIKDVSQRKGIVLDLFAGSGSTLIAAHKTGRRAYLCEIDPVYCDLIIRRWEAFAKDEAEKISFENVGELS